MNPITNDIMLTEIFQCWQVLSITGHIQSVRLQEKYNDILLFLFDSSMTLENTHIIRKWHKYDNGRHDLDCFA